ncbi:MAG: OmpH family outer membrane protein [Gemmatimonadetes bacterium]|nr:OmpH family outer membrane protein [Gemmatimonadota bacterium]
MRHLACAAVAVALSFSPVAAQTPATPATVAQAGVRIGFIRSQVVVDQAPGRSDAEASFRGYITGVRESLSKLRDSVEKMLGDYQKTEATMTAAVKTQRQNLIRGKQEELQSRQQAAEEAARQKQIELMQPITDLVKKAIDDVRSEEGYTVIFDVETQGNPIVSIDKNLDLTDRVIAKLRLMPKPVVGAKDGAAAKDAKPPVGPVAAPAGISRPKPPTE